MSHRVAFGPVLMRFQEASDTHPEWAYGGGSLWLFDGATTNGAVVLQLSAATGRLENTVRVPKVYRPLLAADRDGLWIATPPGGGEPSPLVHVAPGTRTVSVVHRAGVGVLWLVASRHTVWIDTLVSVSKRALARQAIWQFDGPTAQAEFLSRADSLDSGGAVTDDSGGLLTVNPVPTVPTDYTTCDYERVVRIDQHTGKQTLVATVPSRGSDCALIGISPTSATYDHALFFIGGCRDRRVLYRVRSR